MKYFLLLCRFHMFFEIFPTVFAFTFDAGFGEKCAGLMLSLLTDWAFYAVAFLFCYIVILLIFFTAVTVIIFVRIAEVRIVNHFHEITLLTFRFFFLDDWQLSENLSRETSLYSWRPWVWFFFRENNFMRILVGVSFGGTWMGVDGWTGAGVKAVVFISYLTHNIGT